MQCILPIVNISRGECIVIEPSSQSGTERIIIRLHWIQVNRIDNLESEYLMNWFLALENWLCFRFDSLHGRRSRRQWQRQWSFSRCVYVALLVIYSFDNKIGKMSVNNKNSISSLSAFSQTPAIRWLLRYTPNAMCIFLHVFALPLSSSIRSFFIIKMYIYQLNFKRWKIELNLYYVFLFRILSVGRTRGEREHTHTRYVWIECCIVLFSSFFFFSFLFLFV